MQTSLVICCPLEPVSTHAWIVVDCPTCIVSLDVQCRGDAAALGHYGQQHPLQHLYVEVAVIGHRGVRDIELGEPVPGVTVHNCSSHFELQSW